MSMPTSAPNALDLRPLPAVRRRVTVLAAFDRLEVGESFVLVTDRDPTDLCTSLRAERPGEGTWTYLQRGPYVWQLRVTRGRPAS